MASFICDMILASASGALIGTAGQLLILSMKTNRDAGRKHIAPSRTVTTTDMVPQSTGEKAYEIYKMWHEENWLKDCQEVLDVYERDIDAFASQHPYLDDGQGLKPKREEGETTVDYLIRLLTSLNERKMTLYKDYDAQHGTKGRRGNGKQVRG